MKNVDPRTVRGFDRIWGLHGPPKPSAPADDRDEAYKLYFRIFPVDALDGEGFELGSGNGRIAQGVAPRARLLHCIEPSPAGLAATRHRLAGMTNVTFHPASADSIPLDEQSQDFGYSIGVLHHLPDPGAALSSCVRKLKPNAPFLLYVYYGLDNRPGWFRQLWRASDLARKGISSLPFPLRSAASTFMAATLYWPLSRSARLLHRLGFKAQDWPLAFYADSPWRDLQADALDRFGTAVEHRFSRAEVEAMMKRAGLERIRFDEEAPFWTALGFRSSDRPEPDLAPRDPLS